MRWLRHVMRMPQNRTQKIALHQTPHGRKKRGIPHTTWRRTVTSELRKLTQFEAKTEGGGNGNVLKPYFPFGRRREVSNTQLCT